MATPFVTIESHEGRSHNSGMTPDSPSGAGALTGGRDKGIAAVITTTSRNPAGLLLLFPNPDGRQPDYPNTFPVILSYASTYRARVWVTTVAGSCGPGGCLFHWPLSTSVSR